MFVDTCVGSNVNIITLLAVVGPFCTGRGGATREIEGWGGVDPVAMGTNMLLCKTGDCVWTIGGRNRKREGEKGGGKVTTASICNDTLR